MSPVFSAPVESVTSPLPRGIALPPVTAETVPASQPRSSALIQEITMPRPAWIEINLTRFRGNYEAINRDKPRALKVLSVIKDEAYGHGAIEAAKIATLEGVEFFALGTVEEAVTLREHGVKQSLLLLGDREESELPWCVEHWLTCCVAEAQTIDSLGQLAAKAGKRVSVHLKVNTGMNRYGVDWRQATSLAERIRSIPSLMLEGIFSHFAQSDEADRSFAMVQVARFEEAIRKIAERGIRIPLRHICNSGGFLDIPQAHFEMVRLGLLPLGVFPSPACRRLPGIQPVMSVKARIASIQLIQPGESVGYGMHFTAKTPRRIAVLPLGYGDGFPRVRNQGAALIHGRRAPLVGGTTMDSLMVDITDIPEAQLWDEAVVMGQQGDGEITADEIARLKNSISYDVLTGWRARLPRVYVS